jgi:hypothetical protein
MKQNERDIEMERKGGSKYGKEDKERNKEVENINFPLCLNINVP